MKPRFMVFVVFILLATFGPQAIGQYSSNQTTWNYSGLIVEGGTWEMRVTASKTHFEAGEGLTLAVDYTIKHLGLVYNIDRTSGIYTLVTGLRTFDENGDMIGSSHAMASTVLSGVGLPIEGETYGLPTDRFGGRFHHAIDSFIVTPPSDLEINMTDGTIHGTTVHGILLDLDTPPGWYQLRIDLGLQIAERDLVTLFGVNPELTSTTEDEHTFAVTGPIAIGTRNQPRMAWTLFSTSMPSGGVVAVEDQGHIALSRGLGYSTSAILPLTDSKGVQRRYLLEPDFPLVWNPFMRNFNPSLDLDYSTGWMEVRIENPEGSIIDLGGAEFKGRRGIGATTLQNQFEYSFSSYGRHRIELSGWIYDTSGQAYTGGGVYEVDVAKPLDIQTNVLPGTPFYKNDFFDPGFQLYPPVNADVEISWQLDPHSRGNPHSGSFVATANRWGYYTPPIVSGRDRWARNTRIQLNDPGEYRVTFIATFREEDGTIWMGEKILTGVVHPNDAFGLSSRPPAAGSFSITSDARYVPVPADNGDTVILPIASSPDLPTVHTFPIGFFLGSQFGFRMDDASLREIESGSAGTFVTPGMSSSSGLFPHLYPDDIDRRAYLVSTAVRGDGYCQTRINEGSPYDHLPYPTHPWNPGELSPDAVGDIYHFWSSMVYRDVPANSTKYGRYSTGVVLSANVTTPTMHQTGTRLITDGWGAHSLVLHNLAVNPGTIIQKDGAFTPSGYYLPLPPSSVVQFVITPPTGDQRNITIVSDITGYACDWFKRFNLDHEGVWKIKATLVQGAETGGILGLSDSDPWEFFVIDKNNKMPVEFYLPPSTPLDPNSDILILTGDLMGGDLETGTVHISTTFNGAIVEQTTRVVENGAFVYSVDVDQISNSFKNFDPYDSHDRLVISFFADGITTGGRHKFAARTVYIQGGVLYTGEKDYSPIDARTRDELMLELARRAEVQLAHELRGRTPAAPVETD